VVSIEERIIAHEIPFKKLFDEKHKIESRLYEINKKLIFHQEAIKNLLHKQPKK